MEKIFWRRSSKLTLRGKVLNGTIRKLENENQIKEGKKDIPDYNRANINSNGKKDHRDRKWRMRCGTPK